MFFGRFLLLLLLFLLPLDVFLCVVPYNLLVTILISRWHDDVLSKEAPDALPLLLEVVLDFLVR